MLTSITGPQPVMILQVRLNEQVAGEIDGSELRGVRGLAFSVPVVAGVYNLTVFAKDARGCGQETTLSRPVVVL